jgi:hypothetical protein
MNIVLRFHVKAMTLAKSEIADLVGLAIAPTLAKKAWRHYMPTSSVRGLVCRVDYYRFDALYSLSGARLVIDCLVVNSTLSLDIYDDEMVGF